MTPTRPTRTAIPRFGMIVAAVIGFGVGATGFAAVQHDDAPEPVVSIPTSPPPSTSVEDRATTTVEDAATTTVGVVPTTTADDGPSNDAPTTTVDDSRTATVDDGPSTTVDDGPSTTVEDAPTTTVDDGPTTTVDDGPTTTVDDDPSTTAPTGLPAPFTTSYASAGGTVSVSWSGTAFTLDDVTPAPGFRAEIEHQAWDRVRVDFEGDECDARIEIRISDGQLRVGID